MMDIDSDAFRSLDPDTKALVLVGQYLQNWALMESLLNTCIAKVLRLDTLQGLIVCKNVQLRDKIHILKTASALEIFNRAELQPFTAALNHIANISSDRNMIAHDMFNAAEDGDGVVFSVTKAKGTLALVDTRWKVSDFTDRYEDIVRTTSTVMRLADKIPKPTSRNDRPKGGLSVLVDALSHPSPLPQSPLGLMTPLASDQEPKKTPE